MPPPRVNNPRAAAGIAATRAPAKAAAYAALIRLFDAAIKIAATEKLAASQLAHAQMIERAYVTGGDIWEIQLHWNLE